MNKLLSVICILLLVIIWQLYNHEHNNVHTHEHSHNQYAYSHSHENFALKEHYHPLQGAYFEQQVGRFINKNCEIKVYGDGDANLHCDD